MGGMFGAIGVLGALIQRGITGRGKEVQSALFENNVFLVGQHMLQFADDRQAAGADAGARSARGRLRRVHGEGRRADLPRRGERRAVADLLRRARLRRPEGRPAPDDQQPARAARGRRCCPTLRERLRAPQRGRAARRLRGAPACRSRRSASPRTCSTTRTCSPPAAWPTSTLPDGDKAGQTVKTTLFPITLDGQRLGVRLHPPQLRRAHARAAGRARLSQRARSTR